MTMPTGQYGARHIARWSVLVASWEAPKRRHRASARAVLARRTPWSSSSSSSWQKYKTQLLLASNCRTFLLTKAISNRGTKRTPYSAHQSNELRKNKSVGHACSQRAQLVGVTLGWLRGQKLAEKLIFFQSSKKVVADMRPSRLSC